MYHAFGKFIRGKGFSILFYLVSVLLMFYLTVKIGSVAEYVFSVDIYAAVFVVLAVLMFYMLCYFSSKKAEKRAKKLYEACGVVLCVLLNFTMCFLVFDTHSGRSAVVYIRIFSCRTFNREKIPNSVGRKEAEQKVGSIK